MTNGILGTYELYSNISQSLYVCDKTGGAVVTLNVCNRGNTSAFIKVAITANVNSVLNNEWIEFGVEVKPKCVLERTGIMVTSGQYITVSSTADNVSAVCWGVSVGDDVVVPTITQNLGTSPVWVTAAGLSDIYAGDTVSVPLVATSNSNITYSITSGSLPTGLTLNRTSGIISGSLSYTGYTVSGVSSTFTATVTDSSLNSTPRLFSIIKKWRDGSTVNLAVRTGMELVAIGKPSGYYYVQPLGQSAYYMYVDNSRYSGGWVLCVRALNTSQAHWNNDAVNIVGNAGPTLLGASVCKVPTSWMQALRNQSSYTGTTPYWMETTGTFSGGQSALNQWHSSTATLDLVQSANYENARTLCATEYEGPFVDREPNTGTRGFGDHHTGTPYFAYQRHPEEGTNYGFRSDAYGGSSGHLWVK